MERVDIVIAGLGVLAVVATVLGVAFYDSGARDITFATTEAELETQQQVTAGMAEFDWPAPQNATGANLTISISTSTPGNGQATVQIELVGPDGTSHNETASFSVGPQGGQGEFAIEHIWLETPGHERADPEEVNKTRDWDAPIVLRISLTHPGVLPLVPVPASFEVSAGGHAYVYHHMTEAPDPQAV